VLKITRIKLPLANAYLVQGPQTILVDTGAPGDEGRILAAMAKAGVAPHDLALILLTHGHGDHAGSAAALAQQTGAPIALHRADLAQVHAGRNDPLTTTSLEARMIRPFVDKPFPPSAPTVLLDGAVSLRDLGIDLGAEAHVLPTPGHTPGSISLLLPETGDALVGDVLMGGSMGGTLRSGHPNVHYFVNDPVALQESMDRLLASNCARWHVGHGGPLQHDDIAAAQPRLQSRLRDIRADAR
jgi:hydroxyacylglutathione hydrolase